MLCMAVSDSSQPLVDVLLARGLVSNDQLRIAEVEDLSSDGSVLDALLRLGFVSEAVLRDLQSELSGTESVDLTQIIPDPAALQMISRDAAQRLRCLPLSLTARTLTVALADPSDLLVTDRLRALVGAEINVRLAMASAGQISEAIDRFYGFELSIDGVLRELERGGDFVVSETAEHYGHPLVRLLDSFLADAVKRGASDIHFEPEAAFVRVRYRIDGVLHQVRSIHRNCQAGLAVRVKVLGKMNIAEARAPQDGRLSLLVDSRPIEFRVSTLPTLHGENIVLRILDQQRGVLPLDELGLSEYALQQVSLMMARPEGLILVTGPTGSGKTTTLYSMLGRISSEQINIMTMEDPVEYPMPLVRQSSINEQARLDFASGIRAILRQDPDVILVGEIRDAETATMAMRAAMTGHQVYSTLHANSSIKALGRLTDAGVGPDRIAGNLIGVISQRLVRKLCVHCRSHYQPTAGEQEYLPDADEVFQAVGCDQCNNTGYKGRIMLAEVLRIDRRLDEMIAAGASTLQLESCARETGFKSIADEAVRSVTAGQTSFSEVSRVIDFTNHLQRLH